MTVVTFSKKLPIQCPLFDKSGQIRRWIASFCSLKPHKKLVNISILGLDLGPRIYSFLILSFYMNEKWVKIDFKPFLLWASEAHIKILFLKNDLKEVKNRAMGNNADVSACVSYFYLDRWVELCYEASLSESCFYF